MNDTTAAPVLPSGSVPEVMGVEPAPAPDAAGSSPPFLPLPGETPRAFAAFVAYYELGQTRSLAAVANTLGEKSDTVRVWSSRHHWRDRISDLQAGRLAKHLALEQQLDADWSRRIQEFRQQKWSLGQKLIAAATCFLEAFGDRELEKMTLAQVSRAIHIGTRVTSEALRGDLASAEPGVSPLQAELLTALQKAYAPAAPADPNPNQPLHPSP